MAMVFVGEGSAALTFIHLAAFVTSRVHFIQERGLVGVPIMVRRTGSKVLLSLVLVDVRISHIGGLRNFVLEVTQIGLALSRIIPDRMLYERGLLCGIRAHVR